jgi:uncharacterized membrane protein
MSQNYDRIDPSKYKWGLFYYNPDDLRFIVPKRTMGLGYTLNFAQPLSWLVIAVIIAFVIIMNVYTPK